MPTYAYFPGCSASSTGLSFTRSMDYVARRVGVELLEIPDWNCCGATAARMASDVLGHALSARNLALAERMGGGDLDVVVPCAGCYRSLKGARSYTRESDANRERIEALIGMSYEARGQVVNLLEAFSDEEVRKSVRDATRKPLRGLKAACYYGCMLVRPQRVVAFDDPENPQSMDELLRLVGAEPVEWAFKTECCGGSAQVTAPGVARPLVERILQNAVANGAECIVTSCPLCQMNLDMREAEVNAARVARGQEPFDLPCFFFTELIGAALGGGVRELGVDIHFHPAEGFLAETEQRAVRIAEQERAEAEEAARKEAERAERAARARAARAAKKAAAAAADGAGAADAGAAPDSAKAKPAHAKPGPAHARPASAEGREASEEVGGDE